MTVHPSSTIWQAMVVSFLSHILSAMFFERTALPSNDFFWTVSRLFLCPSRDLLCVVLWLLHDYVLEFRLL